MGMSPSCHCICPGTGDMLSSSGGIPTTTECTVCGTAALRYYCDITQPSPGALAACCNSYSGRFLLTHRSGCIWTSDEFALNAINNAGTVSCAAAVEIPPCTSADLSRRVILTITSNIIYTVTIVYHQRGPFAGIQQVVSLNYVGSIVGGNCVNGMMNVPYFGFQTSANVCLVRPGGTINGYPCNAPAVFTAANSWVDIIPVP